MKVILLQDVQRVGEAGAVANVSDGYARNFLIPKKMALEATPGAMKNLEQHRETIKRHQLAEASSASALSERMAGMTLKLKARAGEAGRLYGSITNVMVADTLAAEHGIKVDRRAITFPYPIRVLGTHEAKIHLHKSVEATLAIEVESEE